MTDYLNQKVDIEDPDLVSVIDDLPLWSAPFGLQLLDIMEMKKNMNVLDIGCGPGFPLIEIVARLGNSCKVVGLDPWKRALERVRLKIKVYGLENVEVVEGYAENMPFDNGFFDLIVSNNGINNVQDMNQSLRECFRVSRFGSQMVITLNLEETMMEFYTLFQQILEENHLKDEIKKMKAQIHSKRKPLDEIKKKLKE